MTCILYFKHSHQQCALHFKGLCSFLWIFCSWSKCCSEGNFIFSIFMRQAPQVKLIIQIFATMNEKPTLWTTDEWEVPLKFPLYMSSNQLNFINFCSQIYGSTYGTFCKSFHHEEISSDMFQRVPLKIWSYDFIMVHVYTN